MQPTEKFNKQQRAKRQGAREHMTAQGRLNVGAHKEVQRAKTARLMKKVEKSKSREKALHARVQAHPQARARAKKLASKYGKTSYTARVLGTAGAVIGAGYGAAGVDAHHQAKHGTRFTPGKKLGKGAAVGAAIGAAGGAALGHYGHKAFKRDAPKSEKAYNRHFAAKKADPKKLGNRVRYRAQRWLKKEDRDELIAGLMETVA
jgi:hypothetical protein